MRIILYSPKTNWFLIEIGESTISEVEMIKFFNMYLDSHKQFKNP